MDDLLPVPLALNVGRGTLGGPCRDGTDGPLIKNLTPHELGLFFNQSPPSMPKSEILRLKMLNLFHEKRHMENHPF